MTPLFSDFNSLDWFRYASAQDIFTFSVFVDAIRLYPVFSTFVAFWFGCNIGSFLNVCIYRIPLGISLVTPPSHCPNCNHRITVLENIPIFSYLFLGCKCSSCKQPISPRYMIGEMLTGLCFAASFVYLRWMDLPLSTNLLYALIISVLIPSAVIDFNCRIIPNELTYTLILLAPLFHLFHGILLPPHLPDWFAFLISLVTALLFGGLLSLSAFLGKLLLKRDAFGLGDVKLIMGLAAALGALPVLYIMLIGSCSALVIMPLYRWYNPRRKHRGFAFGPFLAGATAIWLLFGISITNRWLYPDFSVDISAIEFVNPRNSRYEMNRISELSRRREALRMQEAIDAREHRRAERIRKKDSSADSSDAVENDNSVLSGNDTTSLSPQES